MLRCSGDTYVAFEASAALFRNDVRKAHNCDRLVAHLSDTLAWRLYKRSNTRGGLSRAESVTMPTALRF